MKEFTYKICDEFGIHARPAGKLVKLASDFSCGLIMYKDEKCADLKRLFAVMGLSVRCGDTVRVCADGEDEDRAIAVIESFFRNNL